MRSFIAMFVLVFSVSAMALTFPINKPFTHVYEWTVDEGVTGVIPVLSMPAKTLIRKVDVYTQTITSGASAMTLGDADADGFMIDGFKGTVGAYSGTGSLKGAFEGYKFYSSADTIDLTITGTASAGKIKFVIEGIAL